MDDFSINFFFFWLSGVASAALIYLVYQAILEQITISRERTSGEYWKMCTRQTCKAVYQHAREIHCHCGAQLAPSQPADLIKAELMAEHIFDATFAPDEMKRLEFVRQMVQAGRISDNDDGSTGKEEVGI